MKTALFWLLIFLVIAVAGLAEAISFKLGAQQSVGTWIFYTGYIMGGIVSVIAVKYFE
jgi:hypothetical protein